MNPLLLWGIILAAMLSALAFVPFFILPNCASLPVRGKVPGECGTTQMAVIVICAAMFLAGAIFSAYRIAVAVKGGRGEE